MGLLIFERGSLVLGFPSSCRFFDSLYERLYFQAQGMKGQVIRVIYEKSWF